MPKLVPNPSYAANLGVCLRTTARWDERRTAAIAAKEAGKPLTATDELMLLVPQPIRINGRIYRDGEQDAVFRQALLGRAVEAVGGSVSNTTGPDPPA
jgi:hypothetical protein